MVVYLDGVWNEKENLNENCEREDIEHCTMGAVDRHDSRKDTQQDDRHLALALTGWKYGADFPPPEVVHEYFAYIYFDFKTQTSPWGVEPKIYGLFSSGNPDIEGDVLEAMFSVRTEQIAW